MEVTHAASVGQGHMLFDQPIYQLFFLCVQTHTRRHLRHHQRAARDMTTAHVFTHVMEQQTQAKQILALGLRQHVRHVRQALQLSVRHRIKITHREQRMLIDGELVIAIELHMTGQVAEFRQVSAQ